MKTQTALLYLNNAHQVFIDIATRLTDAVYTPRPDFTPSELKEISIISEAWEFFERPLASWHPPTILCCKLSNKLITNAVVTPLGHIYDEVSLSRYLYERQHEPEGLASVGASELHISDKMNIAVHKFELIRELQFNEKLLASIKIHYESPKRHWKTTPKVLRCNLTGKLMDEVVTTPGGKLFDRGSIQAYIQEHQRHPITKEPLHLSQLLPWPYATECANNFKARQKSCCVEAFKKSYLLDFYSQPFYLRNNLSPMKKKLKEGSLCMENIQKYADKKPESRTKRVLLKMP